MIMDELCALYYNLDNVFIPQCDEYGQTMSFLMANSYSEACYILQGP